MIDLDARIKRLRAALGELPALITVTYSDGRTRSMSAEKAVAEAVKTGSGAVEFAGGDKGDGRLTEILSAICRGDG